MPPVSNLVTSPVVLVLIGLLLLAIGSMIVIASIRNAPNSQIRSRLKDLGRQSETTYQSQQSILEIRQLEGSIADRMIVPAIKRVTALLGSLTPGESIASTNRQLSIAGSPLGMSATEFYGLRIVSLAVFSLVAFLLFGRFSGITRLIVAGFLPILGYLMPIAWLRSRVRDRQSKILRALPDTLDTLSVCTAAGLGFDQAIQRISEYFDNPLGKELGRVLDETEVGVSRRRALRNMAERLEVSELSSFISVILQSEELGISISDTLNAQAEQMRILRRFRAQEIAQRMPAKMLFPLAFLILPALLAIIIGPALPAMVDLFSNF